MHIEIVLRKFSFSAEDTVASREANGEQSFSQVCNFNTQS